MEKENFDQYVNWLIGQKESKKKFEKAKEGRGLLKSLLIKDPEFEEEVLTTLRYCVRRGYLSKNTLKRMESLPREDIVDIYLKIENKVPPAPLWTTILFLIVTLLVLTFTFWVLYQSCFEQFINLLNKLSNLF